MSYDFIWSSYKNIEFDLEVPYLCENTQSIDAVIFPGGPNLDLSYMSGIYRFLKSLGYNPFLIGLPGHHNSQIVKIESFDMLSKILTDCLDCFVTAPKLVVGHSLGCWLAHHYLKYSNLKDSYLIDICFPKSFAPSLEFKNLLAQIRKDLNEVDYLNELLPYYFANRISQVNVDIHSLESNFKLSIKDDTIYDNLILCEKIIKNRFEIYCENDIVSGFVKNTSINQFTISSCGHFPMLEKMSELQNIIKRIHTQLIDP